MIFAVSLSLINLILYCVQQFGVTLGVGAETILLVAYLQSMRDGSVDDKEKGFARAVRRVMDFALFCIVVSGLGVVATSYVAGNIHAFFSTIFLFKWSLICIVLVMSIINRGSSLTAGLLQGLSAGTWYALFVVHILAPDAAWLQLGEFYGAWLVGFALCWTLVVFALRGKPTPQGSSMQAAKSIIKPAVVIMPDKAPAVHIAPKPAFVPEPVFIKPAPAVVPPPPKPAPVPTLPVLVVPVAPAVPPPPSPPKPPMAPIHPNAATKPEAFTGLHVMPRTVEEIEKRKAAL